MTPPMAGFFVLTQRLYTENRTQGGAVKKWEKLLTGLEIRD